MAQHADPAFAHHRQHPLRGRLFSTGIMLPVTVADTLKGWQSSQYDMEYLR